MDFDSLAPEFKERARACKSVKELKELAEAVGTTLSDNQLKGVAGGALADVCPKDYQCKLNVTRPECPTALCPSFLEDLINNCTELTPNECTNLIECNDLISCGILKAP